MRLIFSLLGLVVLGMLGPSPALAASCAAKDVANVSAVSKCKLVTDEGLCNKDPECAWSAPTIPESAPAAPKDTAEDKDIIKLDNPIGKGNVQISTIVGKAIQVSLGVIGSVALVVFVYGGFRWLTAAGNSESIEAGTGAMVWATIGIFIIFSSYAILQLVFNAIGAK